MTYDRNTPNAGSGTPARPDGYRVVPTPSRSDGVGQALRKAFDCQGEGDPFESMLRELDRRSGR